jgi:glycine/D-amino acid oxidase-like deaminating enzyme
LKFRDVWVGFRPMSIDNLPIIGKFPVVENVYLNTGHGSRGSIYSFGSAKLISEIVLGK